MENSIIIFTKEPCLGKVKTRIVKTSTGNFIDDKKALKIHTSFLKDTILNVSKLTNSKKHIFFHYYSKGSKNTNDLVSKDFKIHSQKGDHLGERMLNAFQKIITNKKDKVILIGTDSPTLPLNYLTNAFNILENNDIVIGPTFDGGYYLIGMKGSSHAIFEGINWGTSEVFDKTIKKIINKRLKFKLLHPWYDVDTSDDLNFLNNHINALKKSKEVIPNNTFNVLREMN